LGDYSEHIASAHTHTAFAVGTADAVAAVQQAAAFVVDSRMQGVPGNLNSPYPSALQPRSPLSFAVGADLECLGHIHRNYHFADYVIPLHPKELRS